MESVSETDRFNKYYAQINDDMQVEEIEASVKTTLKCFELVNSLQNDLTITQQSTSPSLNTPAPVSSPAETLLSPHPDTTAPPPAVATHITSIPAPTSELPSTLGMQTTEVMIVDSPARTLPPTSTAPSENVTTAATTPTSVEPLSSATTETSPPKAHLKG
jgi:hypothetical protein